MVCSAQKQLGILAKKVLYNIERDKQNYRRLEELGWRVIIVWECEIRHGNTQTALRRLEAAIKDLTAE